jgi:hypothetical protein
MTDQNGEAQPTTCEPLIWLLTEGLAVVEHAWNNAVSMEGSFSAA